MLLRQEALIRKQVEAYAADPSAGASKGQSSIQIRRDWKAKEKQLQVGLLSQLCSSAPASLQECGNCAAAYLGRLGKSVTAVCLSRGRIAVVDQMNVECQAQHGQLRNSNMEHKQLGLLQLCSSTGDAAWVKCPLRS